MKKRALAISVLLFSTGLFADTQAQINQLQSQINALQAQISQMGNGNTTGNMLSLDTQVPFGTMSKVEMPLALIKNRSLTNSYWVLGGQIQSDLQDWNGSQLSTTSSSNPNYSNGSSVFLTKVYLFNEINLGQNAMGFIALKGATPNYNVVVDRAFLLVGKLSPTEPLFITAGSTYLPFGSFSGNGPLNNNLTTSMFRVSPTNQFSATAGMGPFTLIGSMYNNNSSVNSSINYLLTGLFAKSFEGYNVNFGASYLSNIVGTNSNLGAAYSQFGSSSSTQPLQSNTNPAWDVNFSFGKPMLSLLGEYVTTLRSTLNQGQSIGKISAWSLGTTGTFPAMNTPYYWQLAYSATNNMQNVPMPLDGNFSQSLKTSVGFKHQWLGSIQGQYWKNVYLGPEVSYGTLYSNQHTYTVTMDATAYF